MTRLCVTPGCAKCGRDLPRDAFPAGKNHCHACRALVKAAWDQGNKKRRLELRGEHERAYSRAYYAANRVRILARKKSKALARVLV